MWYSRKQLWILSQETGSSSLSTYSLYLDYFLCAPLHHHLITLNINWSSGKSIHEAFLSSTQNSWNLYIYLCSGLYDVKNRDFTHCYTSVPSYELPLWLHTTCAHLIYEGGRKRGRKVGRHRLTFTIWQSFLFTHL